MDYKSTLMYSEICEQPDVLERIGKSAADALAAAAAKIKAKKPAGVVIAARGTSNHAGVFFKYVCETVWGLPVAFAAPGVLSLYNGKLDLSSQLVIGVSQSGKAADVIEVVKRGIEGGAVTVAVTNDPESPLAKTAEFHLFCNAGEEKSVAATKTFTAQCMLLLKLVESVTGDAELKAELAAAAALSKTTLVNADAIGAVAATFKDAHDAYVLGRGMSYGLTLETSLKLQETTYLRAKSYAASDFHHGPFAVVDAGTKTILLAPDDESVKDMREMAEKLKGVGADITLITNAPKKFEGLYDRCIEVSPAGKYNAFFAFAPAVQLLACTLSVLKGLSPDTPRGLKKVTITK